MIVITGASGKTGSKAAELLLERAFRGADAAYLLVLIKFDNEVEDVFVPALKKAA